ncbi:MAG TPA: hypothetical protein VKZ18_29220 [Polyangia bacterium]|nr:hypothetical protein [Polyangia bacterium]
MRVIQIAFSSETAARAAVRTIESYGYTAAATGSVVRTDCPPLLAMPALERQVGLHQMENVRLVPAGGEQVLCGAAA